MEKLAVEIEALFHSCLKVPPVKRALCRHREREDMTLEIPKNATHPKFASRILYLFSHTLTDDVDHSSNFGNVQELCRLDWRSLRNALGL
jgi:hypothetical protein